MTSNSENVKSRRALRWFSGLMLMTMVLFAGSVLAQVSPKPTIGGSVFGGGRMANVDGNAYVEMKDGTVVKSIFGGNDISGHTGNGTGGFVPVAGADTSQISAGTVYGVNVTGGTVTENVFGGANGYYACHADENTYDADGYASINYTDSNFTDENVVNPVKKIPALNYTSVLISTRGSVNNVYGGGNLAPVGYQGISTGSTSVNIFKGNITGNVFAGGNMASVYVTSSLTVDNTEGSSYASLTITGGVYGGNDKSGQLKAFASDRQTKDGVAIPDGASSVEIYGAPTIGKVFGGGNGDYQYTLVSSFETEAALQSAIADNTRQDVIVCSQEAPEQDASFVYVKMSGENGSIGEVYGGGNAAAITGTSGVSFDTKTVSTIVLLSGNGTVGTVYGGCQKADVEKSTYVALNSEDQTVGTIYGGCNVSGDVKSETNVLISNGLVTEAVFGGANGYYGCEGSNGYYGGDFDGDDGVEVSPSIKMPTVKTTNVTISGGQIGTQSNSASVYGGGNFAAVGGSTNNGVVNFEVTTGALIWGSVYGGGNMASVNGYTNFEISGGTINGDVYGGNDKVGVVTGVNRPSGTYSSTTAWPGGYPEKYELSAANAASYVLLTGTPTITGSVFGGGNGDYTYSESWNKCNFTDANKPVQVSAFVDINVDCDASINKVFAGGNNATVGSTSTTTESYTTAQAGKANVYLNVTSNPLADHSTCDNTQVGTIFGGNNKAQMYVVPKIDLRQGKVGNVYGGGNMGAMAGNNASLDGHGLALSTYVRIPSPNVEVAENIYGGCKAADVTNETYVYLDKGQVDGKIFGANDIAGNVGTANVIIDGVSVVNEVYGGGNGEYCYIEAAFFDPEHPQFTVNNDNTTFTVSGRPTTTTAKVEVQGAAKVHKNVYGGGLAGDCVNTIVNLNLTDNGASDAENGILYGMVFGGGRGDIDNIGKKATATCIPARCGDANAHAWGTHVGNVTGTATLNINTIGKMMTETTPQGTTRNAIFGGGHAGDVANAVVNLNTTCKAHIPSIYGGCLASDLTGTTTMNINGASTLPQGFSYNVDTLYGGNDYAGITNATRMTVNSGTFQHVFGAGNGEYNYWSDPKITALGASSSCADTVPYSMDVMVTFNGGTVQGSVYGGGNLGLVGNRDLYPANITSADYGKIVVNVHGGTFNRHIFTGARGTKAMNKKFFGHGTSGDPTIANDAVVFPQHLAYATKVLNMDGGYVKFSVYGGSESVDDGFFWECVGNDSVGSGYGKHYTNTTLRPSSILNIVGGEISKNVYGGGYQGNIYGSVYVNIGYHAVNDSPVWAKHYGKWVAGSMPSYATFEDYKPWVLDIHGRPYDYVEKQTDLTASRVTLGASVYNGSDWGEAGSNAYFYTRGFYGGESNILIDGDGYNTHLNPAYSSLPGMNINYSIIGAGTSTEGGDVNRLITFKNYGDYECPNVSKTIYSIQRADKVILDHVYINLAGDQDAYSAYVSPSYTFCRIDTLIFRVDNIVQMQAPGIYIGNMVSMKDREQSCDITSDGHLYAASDIYPPTLSCDHTDPEFCDLLPSNRGSHYESGETPIIAAANTLVMQNGSYMKVSPFVDKKVNATDAAGFDGMDDPNHKYGHVYGYMYLLAQDNTQSYVYAAEKVADTSLGANDDGFVSARECDNTVGEGDNKEIAYSNVTDLSPNYRSWKVGTKQGTRTRHITIIANAHPDDRQNFSLTGSDPVAATLTENDGTSDPNFQLPGNLAYAKASLELPPATGGSFYVINSISIDRDNGGQITMVDNTFDLNHSTLSGASPSYAAYGLSNPATNINEVVASPNNTFGLMFSSGQNFNTDDCWNSTSGLTEVPTDDSPIEHRQLTNGSTRYSCWPQTVISGNNFISSQDGYISNAVNGNGSSGVIPTIDFVLTYCKNLSATITRDVVFTMYEFDAEGKYIGPIDVTVTIATVVNAIDDLEAPVLAMYNEGNYNEYVRKVTIPATFSQKQLYLEGIEWHEEKQVIQGYNRVVVTESNPVIADPVSAPSQSGDVTGETTTYVDDAPTPDGNGDTTQVRHYTITTKVVDGSTTTTHITTYDVTTKTYRENGSNPDSSWFRMMATGSVPLDNKHFSVKLSPTEASSDNVNNTLGWYHIEERELDVFDLANKDYHATTGYDLSDSRLTPVKDHQQLNNYDSYDYNADGSVTTDDKTKLKNPQDRLWIGTLDGRATASMDVTLGFNGSLFYEDQYAVPLAWATLHFVAINTNASDDGTHAEQRFDVKVKIRTRSEGDTIYMAPDSVLIRQVVTSAGDTANVQLASFEKQQIEQLKKIHPTWSYRQCYDARLTGLNVEDDKRIKNNPARYVQSFKAAMMTFVEGDVLDIMETITINDGSNPISVSGEDYSVIPIIRYSGSHCRFPGLGCANYNPLIVVSGDGMLSMRNVSFNGSGCTRVKAESPRRGGSTNEAGEISTLDDFNGQTVYGYGYQQVPDASDICLNVGGIYFNENHGPNGAIGTREKTLLFADAPMVVVTGNGTANFAKNVTFTNNFSKAQNPAVEFTGSETTGNIERAQRVVYGGGALCLKAETIDTTWTGTGNSRTVSSISINKHNPQLILGDMTKVYDNAVVDWSTVEYVYEERYLPSTAAQQVDARESGVGPRNYGAGIYVDGGTLNLGTGAEQIHMEIKRNYYLQAVPTISDKKFVVTNAPLRVLEKTANRKGHDYQFTHYELDTTRADKKSGKLALSNVYLMRTPGTTAEGACDAEIAKVRLDKRSDLAYFPNTFADGSSVGISKWFPGYTPWDMQPRDTIAFARIAKGKSDASISEKVYNANVFFNDSSYFHQTSGNLAFKLDSENPNKTLYWNTDRSSVTNKDLVYLFYHSTVNQYSLYFQRCATFGKGVTQGDPCTIAGTSQKLTNFMKVSDSVYYRWDPQATCSGNTDTLFFRLGGGFFPYSYRWIDMTNGGEGNLMRERYTTGTAAIASNAALRRKSEVDSLTMVDMILPPGESQKVFTYLIKGNDLTGHCEVSQQVQVKVLQNLDVKTYTDVNDFLGHGSTYVMSNPGLDSSNFHDYSETIDGVTHYYYPTTTLNSNGERTSTSLTRIQSTAPKYLRTYKLYSIHPSIYPVAYAANAAKPVEVWSNNVEIDWTDKDNNSFCPGDVVELRPKPVSDKNFVMWDYDASANENANFVVSSDTSLNSPVAYYEPNDYWWQVVTTKPDGYQEDYYGNVTISNNEGLAWLISVVNGYNGQEAHTFRFDQIKINANLDMSAHKWTPLGAENNQFEGTISSADTAHPVLIQGIIANEASIPYMGVFGYTDNAKINNINFGDVFVKGNHYVGGLVGRSTFNTEIRKVNFNAKYSGDPSVRTANSYGATLVGTNCIGGVVGTAANTKIDECSVSDMKLMGNCIYVGGVAGLVTAPESGATVTSNIFTNNSATAVDQSRLAALYAGGAIGYSEPSSKRGVFGRKDAASPALLMNNYIEFQSGDHSHHVGGLVGNASDIDIRNNYVYGTIKGIEQMGGLVAMSGYNVNIDHCYFVSGSAHSAVGIDEFGSAHDVTTFYGAGNQVRLDERVGGYTNLTRALNGWVKRNSSDGQEFRTWRSDLDNENNGYPLFGTPDVIQIYDTLVQTVCDIFDWDGIELNESGIYTVHIVDSLDYLDSTATLILTVNYHDETSIVDSVELFSDYANHGFSFSAQQLMMLLAGNRGAMVLNLTDTLQTVHGCDSIVNLTLHFYSKDVSVDEAEHALSDVKVYPNPTRGIVHVEGADIRNIEVYDATSRCVLRKEVNGDETVLDLTNKSTGSYYIRVNTANGSVVKKLIKK